MATWCIGVQKREGEDHEPFETVIHEFKHEKYHQDIVDSELTAEDQAELVKRFKALVKERTGKVFPERSVGTAPRRGGRRVRFLDE